MPWLLIGIAVAVGYVLSKGQAQAQTATALPGGVPTNNSNAGVLGALTGLFTGGLSGTGAIDVSSPYGIPGTVTVGGAPIDMNPGGGMTTDTQIQFGVQTAASVLQKIPFPPTQIAASVLQTISSIVGMFSAHHAAALAAEGKALNDSDKRMLNMYVLIVQGVINGEIRTYADADSKTQQVLADWYGEVKPVQRGMWHYTGQDLSADFNTVWKQRKQPPTGAPGYSDYHAPDPCNGACVIGHFFTERNRFLVLQAVQSILSGGHGILVLPEIPAHDTQLGSPEIDVVY